MASMGNDVEHVSTPASPPDSPAASPQDSSSKVSQQPILPTLGNDGHDAHHHDDHPPLFSRATAAIALGALGVVYGDIGTSPLYSIKECFSPSFGLAPTQENILGVCSLVFWALTIIVVFKYITVVLRADNNGEGGIMSLVALLKAKLTPESKTFRWLVRFAVFGTALLMADGMITPAISVLSAMEGLEIVTPVFKPFIVPLTLVILVSLFMVQKRGTGAMANVFGPLMLIWFSSIGLLGFFWTLKCPLILGALNPSHIVDHFARNGWHGFALLGSVVLCITGAEALYADMGHFGRHPITLAWYAIAYPALVFNYFGQGAILVLHGEAVRHNPFYSLAPTWLLFPLVVVATLATIIASQAMISGAYSLARQSIQLGYSPRLSIKHTSSSTSGQIYIPEINTMLMIACCALVIKFQESTHLAAAYGIAVMGTMTINTLLLSHVMKYIWKWPLYKTALIAGLFLSIEIPFLTANLSKILHGGYIPLCIGAAIYLLMTTWHRGRKALSHEIRKALLPLKDFLEDVKKSSIYRTKGTAVFMTSSLNVVPPVLLHHFKHNRILHERVVFLGIVSETRPEMGPDEIVEFTDLGDGFFQLIARYGFMQTPNVPEILDCASRKGLPFVLNETSFFLGREALLLTGQSDMPHWRKWLFRLISRNAQDATGFFRIPPNRVVELGTQIEL